MTVATISTHNIFHRFSTLSQDKYLWKMASIWNHTIRRYIQTTAARRSAADHGSSEGICLYFC